MLSFLVQQDDLSNVEITPEKLDKFKLMLATIQRLIAKVREANRGKAAAAAAAAGAASTESIASTAKGDQSEGSTLLGPIQNGISQQTTELAPANIVSVIPPVDSTQPEDPTEKLLKLLKPQPRQRGPTFPSSVADKMKEMQIKTSTNDFPLPNLSYTRCHAA